jgi:methylenetetrahydrofolate dehydrogenase (NADP+)/methenyltetrahydrofolate cyclohydrolase/formyltetrahydrofolate synthetase
MKQGLLLQSLPFDYVCTLYNPSGLFHRRADIVIAAIGRPHFVKADWLKPKCTVIDVGINFITDPLNPERHKLVGDVDFDGAKKVASKITSVPGGVGPMTIAMLLHNTLRLASMFGVPNKKMSV